MKSQVMLAIKKIPRLLRRLVVLLIVVSLTLLEFLRSRRHLIGFLESPIGDLRQTNFSLPPLPPPSSSSQSSSVPPSPPSITLNGGNNNSTLFDYKAYWAEVLEAALATTHEQQKSSDPTPCPKVYVYDLPAKLSDTSFPRHLEVGWQEDWGEKLLTKVFGGVEYLWNEEDVALKGYLRDTHPHAFGSILEYRLRSSAMCRTFDPQHADLFFVPVLTKPKLVNQWRKACKKVRGEMVENALPYLNETNACRHFFAGGESHYCLKFCHGWFSNPVKRLKPFQRLAYSHFDFQKHPIDSPLPRHTRLPINDTQATFPNLVSVPYPTTFRFHGEKNPSEPDLPQFVNGGNRSLLMSFIGNDFHGDVAVRKLIVQQCRRYHEEDPNLCQMSDFSPQLMTAKSKAVFCMEPAGDGPWRKSVYDTISMGCIPVIFSELTDDVAPWYWGDTKPRGRVLVPREDFVAGRIDLKKLLQSIPPRLVELMQSTLKEKSRQFQYSLDEDPEDGVRVALDGLHRQALDMELRGACGYES